MADRPPLRTTVSALQGDQKAMVALVEWAFDQAGGEIEDLRREVEYHREEEWTEEEARTAAMAGEVTPKQTVGALSDIHTRLIQLTALMPAIIGADEENIQQLRDLWRREAIGLLLALHNPTIKYGLIGGMREEVREDSEQYVERMNREVWGTLLAITSTEEITAGDFPPETGGTIREIEQAMQDAKAKQGGD